MNVNSYLFLFVRPKSGCYCTIASRSAATRPVILESVSHSTIWKPGGLVGMPPEAKLPNSHLPLTMRQRLGYLTATTAWYVTGLTLELEGSISPQEWMLLMPAVSELTVACRSPAIGCRVAACCSMYASLTKDRRKSMAVPSSSSGSTNEGRRALSWGVAALKTPVAPVCGLLANPQSTSDQASARLCQ